MNNDDLYFDGKYRIPSSRLEGWDYRNPFLYFVTICAKNNVPFFGHVEKGVMRLNALGKYAFDYMQGITRYKDNADLVIHVVMPNHVHAIIKLKGKISGKKINKFGPLIPGSLSSLINHYKGRVTNYAKKNDLPWNGWQDRFHDNIIRNQNQYEKIYDYIVANPSNWKFDKYFRS